MALQLFVVAIVLASASLVSIEGYHIFQTRIPNGNRVPNPCNRSAIWPGVGHRNSSGGGPRNPFGLDFAANGFVWNAALCKKDSDGDGMTNGQELGDPECKWTVNGTSSGVPMSHPGICEPLDKPDCIAKNTWLMNCTVPTFNCPAIKEPGVKRYDVRLPVSTVPAQATTYICYQFQFPADNVSDIIAFEPIVDNAHVVHHIVIFACVDEPQDHNTNQTFYCGMVPSCNSIIAGWAVGVPGQCMDPRIGFRIGQGGFRYGVLQVHWNNHELMSGQTDSSGLRIHHTSNLRSKRAEILSAGQDYLDIPANTPNVAFNGGCSSGCTKRLSEPLYISISFFHMHLLGRSGNITLYRNGTFLQTIQNVPAYDFNTPEFKSFSDPIEVRPGDEIRTTCVYDSTGKTTPTHFGEGTYDEMCYGLLIYFPASPQLNLCTKWKTIEVCNPYSFIYSKCNFTDFLQLVAGVPARCSDGCNSTTCMNTMKSIYSTGCSSQPDAIQFLAYFYFPRTLKSNDTTFFRCLNETQPVEATTATSTERIPTISHDKIDKNDNGSTTKFMINLKDRGECEFGDKGKCAVLLARTGPSRPGAGPRTWPSRPGPEPRPQPSRPGPRPGPRTQWSRPYQWTRPSRPGPGPRTQWSRPYPRTQP